MKKVVPYITATVLIMLTIGCAKDPHPIVIPKDAAEMVVSFDWEGIEDCTHASPEIRVRQIPDGTTEFHVRLKDIDLPVYNHGGGMVVHDGSGIIPAGALQLGYNGPCLPPGERHKYEFSVMAKDANGEIIGFGRSRQSFPPKR